MQQIVKKKVTIEMELICDASQCGSDLELAEGIKTILEQDNIEEDDFGVVKAEVKNVIIKG